MPFPIAKGIIYTLVPRPLSQVRFAGQLPESANEEPVTLSADEYKNLKQIEKTQQSDIKYQRAVSTFAGTSLLCNALLGLAVGSSNAVALTALGIGATTTALTLSKRARLEIKRIAGLGTKAATSALEGLRKRLKKPPTI
ncbi:MAG TPA: hypothetical protein V6C52_05560 [Coleofasciculaceae cyanobacterium]|jgi:hypothetical protein